nr:hypothetical protein GCM10020092_012680 [Actinoplanes digitatis]
MHRGGVGRSAPPRRYSRPGWNEETLKRWQQALAAVVGLTGLLAATSPPGGGTDEQPMVITSAHAGRRAEPVYLILRGQLSGLYPGAVKQIKVTLVNDSGHPIRLHRLDGWPVTSSRRECRPSLYQPADPRLPGPPAGDRRAAHPPHALRIDSHRDAHRSDAQVLEHPLLDLRLRRRQQAAPVRRPKRTILIAGVALTLAVGGTLAANATWSIPGRSAPIQLKTAEMPRGPKPDIAKQGGSAVVTWPAQEIVPGVAMRGYVVTRYDADHDSSFEAFPAVAGDDPHRRRRA